MKSTRNIFFFTLFLVLSCQTKKMEKESQNEDATSSKQTDFSAEDYTLKVKNLLLVKLLKVNNNRFTIFDNDYINCDIELIKSWIKEKYNIY